MAWTVIQVPFAIALLLLIFAFAAYERMTLTFGFWETICRRRGYSEETHKKILVVCDNLNLRWIWTKTNSQRYSRGIDKKKLKMILVRIPWTRRCWLERAVESSDISLIQIYGKFIFVFFSSSLRHSIDTKLTGQTSAACFLCQQQQNH